MKSKYLRKAARKAEQRRKVGLSAVPIKKLAKRMRRKAGQDP